jgi:hypothetical protein
MLFVDRQTRAVVANQADAEGRLEKTGDVFAGTMPPDVIVASTATTWARVKWTMLAWPMPSDKNERLLLMAHELWHRIQDDLGLPASGFGNRHLDTRDGRIWLQLECRALRAALEGLGEQQRRAIVDALIFRTYRRSLSPNAAVEERALEMNEGLAEYTGIRLTHEVASAAVARATKNLRDLENWETFARSFAYATGPAYGLLLDGVKPDWRKGLNTKDDLGALLRGALSIGLPGDLAAEASKRADAYDAEPIIAVENERTEAQWRRQAQYRKRFIYDPVLVIPLQRVNIGFDPLRVEALGDFGTVYPMATISDVWGVLKVTGGVLMDRDWKTARVPTPGKVEARSLQGDGWTLQLNEGWTLRAGERRGDFVVTKINGS